jgi:hypothetical protein
MLTSPFGNYVEQDQETGRLHFVPVVRVSK